MTFTDAERKYLADQPLGRLATIAGDGFPQNKPVGFHLNDELDTIDIYGMAMESSAKYHNVRTNPHVSFVVDSASGVGAGHMHMLEIRGLAEPTTMPEIADGHLSAGVIRIRPRRILAYNVDPDRPAFYARDL
jgi:pyridoxamine 5'-phosphate oxidase family protein